MTIRNCLFAGMVVSLATVSAGGCIRTAGGGSVGEIEPDQTSCHFPIRVGIKCKLYDGRKATATNHTNVRLYYVRGQQDRVTVVEAEETKSTSDGVSFFASIPADKHVAECDSIEYWFEFTVDGTLNKSRHVVILPRRSNAATAL